MNTPKNPCPECSGTGSITETICYTNPPLPDIWATHTKRAWPPVSRDDVREVLWTRTCCRCGGDGLKRGSDE